MSRKTVYIINRAALRALSQLVSVSVPVSINQSRREYSTINTLLQAILYFGTTRTAILFDARWNLEKAELSVRSKRSIVEQSSARSSRAKVFSKHTPSPSGTKNRNYEINYDDGIADLRSKLDTVVAVIYA